MYFALKAERVAGSPRPRAGELWREFRVALLRQAGWRPVGVFAAATGANLLVALSLATLLFGSFQLAAS